MDYFIPEGISGTLIFYDIYGKQVLSYNLESGNKHVYLNDEALFKEGIYNYALILGDKVVSRDKLVIVK